MSFFFFFLLLLFFFFFFFNDTATTEIYTLSLHDALPIFLIKRIINIHFDLDKLVNTEVNFKSRVLEWAQKEKHELIFRVIDEIGEKQSKQYLVAVIVDGKNIAQAQDYNIKGAEKLASERAWQKLND